jgi:predicted nucleic acid-binding protein
MIVYDTPAVLALLRSEDGADAVVEALTKTPGAITTLTLAEVLATVPLERLDTLRDELAAAFDVVMVTEADAYVGAYMHRRPDRVWPRYSLTSDVNSAVASRLGAGFFPIFTAADS